MIQDSTLFIANDGWMMGRLSDSLSSVDVAPCLPVIRFPNSDSLSQPRTEVFSSEAVYGLHAVLVAHAGQRAVAESRNSEPLLFEGTFALGIVFLFLVLFRYIRNYFSMLVPGLFSYRVAEKQFKENSLLAAISTRPLLIFSSISIGFFCWLLWPVLNLSGKISSVVDFLPWYYILFITGGFVLFLLLKISLMYAIDYIGKCRPAMRMVIYFGQLTVITCGIVLFPLSLLMAASDYGVLFNSLLNVCLVVVGVIFLLYFLRIIQVFFSAHISIFFLILYLCTFEIIPFLLLYSFLSLS